MTEENAIPQLETPAPNEAPTQEAAASATPAAPDTPPQKRGPGRPRKDGSTPPGVKAEKPGAAKPAPEKPSRRGAKMSAEAVSTLARQIQGMHAMAAMMSGIPILQITDQESVLLAGGISAVAEEYGLALDGKTGAALQLFGAAAMVYAPRILQIQAMRRQAKANAPVDANIVG